MAGLHGPENAGREALAVTGLGEGAVGRSDHAKEEGLGRGSQSQALEGEGPVYQVEGVEVHQLKCDGNEERQLLYNKAMD